MNLLPIRFGNSGLSAGDNFVLYGTKRSISSFQRIIGLRPLQTITRNSGYPDTRQVDHESIRFNELEDSASIFVACGGGATLDAAKILISRNRRFMEEGKLFLIPTNVGSGAEVTDFATLWDYQNGKKYSISCSEIRNREIYYDYRLMAGNSENNLLNGLFDALSHSYDSLFSVKTNPGLSYLAKETINGILKELIDFENKPRQFPILQHYSTLAAQCINHTKTSLSHGLSYGLTLHLSVDHGEAVARILLQCIYQYESQMRIVLSEDTLNQTKWVLEKLIPEKVFLVSPGVKKKVLASIDWQRAENFAIERSRNEDLALLNKALDLFG